MRFYKQPLDQQPHRFYCGVDLHARTLSLCILDATGTTVLHQTIAIRRHGIAKRIGSSRQILLKPRLPLVVENVQVHAPCVQIDAAIVLMLLVVKPHGQ